MTRPIGYYIHHQGIGHWRRAALIASASRRPFTLIGTFATPRPAPPGVDLLALPDDRIEPDFRGEDKTSTRPSAFHYAPLQVEGLRHRMAAIAAWCATNDPALFVVDVSVEVALFVRLLSVPTAVVRLAGPRNDDPHLEAFRAADVLLAPFPEIFESERTPGWVRHKTIYGGFLADAAPPIQTRKPGRSILVVLGTGGSRIDSAALIAAASATPSFCWHVYGPLACDRTVPGNLKIHGWRADIAVELDAADIVIGGAGDGLLADVACRAKRFICLPEDRAFQEQHDKARTLAAHDMALVLTAWPAAEEWPTILQRATALDPLKLYAQTDGKAVARFAAAIEAAAAVRDV